MGEWYTPKKIDLSCLQCESLRSCSLFHPHIPETSQEDTLSKLTTASTAARTAALKRGVEKLVESLTPIQAREVKPAVRDAVNITEKQTQDTIPKPQTQKRPPPSNTPSSTEEEKAGKRRKLEDSSYLSSTDAKGYVSDAHTRDDKLGRYLRSRPGEWRVVVTEKEDWPTATVVHISDAPETRTAETPCEAGRPPTPPFQKFQASIGTSSKQTAVARPLVQPQQPGSAISAVTEQKRLERALPKSPQSSLLAPEIGTSLPPAQPFGVGDGRRKRQKKFRGRSKKKKAERMRVEGEDYAALDGL